jgi:hypothetical protein
MTSAKQFDAAQQYGRRWYMFGFAGWAGDIVVAIELGVCEL